MARVEGYECEHCKKLYKSEEEYLKCVSECNDEYTLSRKIKCNEENNDIIEIEYNHKKLSDIIANNGQLCISVYENNSFDFCVALDKNRIDELIKVLEEFRTAYQTENSVRKVKRSDSTCE